MKFNNKGFTIVELLVVIVVIAILSVVIVVAYNGAQQRSATVAYSSAVTQLVKAIQLEHTFTGRLPTSDTTCFVQTAAALPASTDFDAGVCLKSTDGTNTATYTYNQAFIDQFEQKKSFPNASLPLSKGNFTDSGVTTTITSRGIAGSVTQTATGYTVILTWFPPVSGQCPHSNDFSQLIPNYQGGYCWGSFTLR